MVACFTKNCVALQNGLYCPKSQPAYSAYREASFGHGILEFLSPTEATWSWHRYLRLPLMSL